MPSHAEQTKKMLENNCGCDQDKADAWGRFADGLRTAAEVLWTTRSQARDHSGEPVEPQNEQLDTPATMLYGFALENLIKGYLIKKHGGFSKARSSHGVAWSRHRIHDLATATGFSLDDNQRLLLKSLEAFIRWAGRYPVPLKREEFTLPKQYRCGCNITQHSRI